MNVFLLDLLLIFDISLILLVMLMATFSLTHIFGAPFVPTPKHIVREMLSFADLAKGETFIDLGSGDGSLLMLAVKDFGAKQAIGYEINPFLVWMTQIRARLLRLSSKVKVRRVNFFKSEVPDVDVVATYLWPGTMDKLRIKLKNELAPTTRIISRGFTFTGVEPEKMKEGKVSRLYLYRAGDL